MDERRRVSGQAQGGMDAEAGGDGHDLLQTIPVPWQVWQISGSVLATAVMPVVVE